jgi:hypothetical protein
LSESHLFRLEQQLIRDATYLPAWLNGVDGIATLQRRERLLNEKVNEQVKERGEGELHHQQPLASLLSVVPGKKNNPHGELHINNNNNNNNDNNNNNKIFKYRLLPPADYAASLRQYQVQRSLFPAQAELDDFFRTPTQLDRRALKRQAADNRLQHKQRQEGNRRRYQGHETRNDREKQNHTNEWLNSEKKKNYNNNNNNNNSSKTKSKPLFPTRQSLMYWLHAQCFPE